MGNGTEPSVSQVRKMAAQLLYEIFENGAYANLALDKALKNSGFNLQEKNLLTEIVNGTVRMLKHLDWVLKLFLKGGLEKQHPWLRNILRISLYQILFMDNIPEYACVNDAVELTAQRSNRNLAKVCNAVLRNIIRNREKLAYPQEGSLEYLAVFYSHPEWMVKYFLDNYGYEHTELLLIYNNTRPQVNLRSNSLKISRDDLLQILIAEGCKCHASSSTPWGINVQVMGKAISDMNSFHRGLFYVQNDASMLAAAILNPSEGDKVLDLASGVGGKSSHLAEYMKNKGQILAFDLYKQKLALLKQNCNRLGINIVEAASVNIFDIDSQTIKAGHILLDAPCSGLGVLNRRADSRWRKNIDDINTLTELQASLLEKASLMLDENGLLLYSTCTINRSENEEIVNSFLIEHWDFRLEDFADNISFFPLDSKDRESAARGMLTIIPGKYQTDGMFYALIRRKPNS
ncbi:MAG: 16S rRNA (cytosine(967)-C(5))-methyltransferase RsmB [Syntrophomonadaceae bacterium]|nr:16S rRNA (cytosine(967)-C(5))-methyltransferase RsmB [Syntrophomonadaceae bacterium]